MIIPKRYITYCRQKDNCRVMIVKEGAVSDRQMTYLSGKCPGRCGELNCRIICQGIMYEE